MKSLLKIISIACIALFLSSCGKGVIFKERKTFENNNWIRMDHDLTFQVPVEDIDENYDVNLYLRYAAFFASDKLKVQLIIISPSGESRSVNSAFLIRDKEGRLQGEGMGDIFDTQLAIKKYMVFNEKGTYKFILRNLMDTYDNPGVMDIALEVKRAKLDVKIDK